MLTKALDRLPPKKQQFCREYVTDLNATQAAIRAGYAMKGAKQRGSLLLTDGDVRAAVAELQAAVAERLDITVDYLVKELLENHRLAREGNPVLDRYGRPTGKSMRQISASTQALNLIAELSGLKVDRKAVITLDITKMSEADLVKQERLLLDMIEAKPDKLENADKDDTLH